MWYDAFALKVGDSLMSSIDLGLRKSKFGVVILSAAFFRKDWPQRELHALAQKQSASQKVILPVWHNVTVEDVRDHFLLLADVVALKWSDGIQTVVDGLLESSLEVSYGEARMVLIRSSANLPYCHLVKQLRRSGTKLSEQLWRPELGTNW